MPRTLTLTRSASVTLDGTGAGTVQAGPSAPGETWQPAQVSVSCSAVVTTGACQASIYAGAGPGQGTFIDGTFSGDTGDSTDRLNGVTLFPGQSVFVQWSGGVPGALATMRLQGQRTVP